MRPPALQWLAMPMRARHYRQCPAALPRNMPRRAAAPQLGMARPRFKLLCNALPEGGVKVSVSSSHCDEFKEALALHQLPCEAGAPGGFEIFTFIDIHINKLKDLLGIEMEKDLILMKYLTMYYLRAAVESESPVASLRACRQGEAERSPGPCRGLVSQDHLSREGSGLAAAPGAASRGGPGRAPDLRGQRHRLF